MASASDGYEELALAGELDCGNDVSHIATADNKARPPIDHTIINFASHLIARIVRLQQCPTQTGLESVNAGRVQHKDLLHDPQITGPRRHTGDAYILCIMCCIDCTLRRGKRLDETRTKL